MATMDGPFAAWLSQAGVRESRLNPDQVGVLKAAYHFRESCGEDYYSYPFITLEFATAKVA